MNISGDAATVGGFTVGKSVPGDAKFTDTTYSVDTSSGLEMTGTQIAIDNVPVSKGGTGTNTLTSGQVLIGSGTNAVTTRAIDTTTGGTADSNSLITSGAVNSGLAGKANAGHHHTVNQIDDLAFDPNSDAYNATSNPVATVDTVNDAVSAITAESLNLSKAMRFIGVATVAIANHSTTNPAISGYDFGTNGANAKLGDVIIDSNSDYEFV